jgi:hypothetical protein
MTMSILVNKMEKEIKNCTGNFLTFTMKEQDLKDLIRELRGQQNPALNLTAVSFARALGKVDSSRDRNSASEVFRILAEHRGILKSIRWQTARELQPDRRRVSDPDYDSQEIDNFSVFNLDLDSDDKTFAFDDELTKLEPYIRALAK